MKEIRKTEKEEEIQEFIEQEFRRAEYGIENNEFLIENKMFRRDTSLLPPLSLVPIDLYKSLTEFGNENIADTRYKSVFAVEWISNTVIQKIIWFLYFDLCKCISFFKTRLKKPFHRCNFRSTNNSLEVDCVIFLMNINCDAVS